MAIVYQFLFNLIIIDLVYFFSKTGTIKMTIIHMILEKNLGEGAWIPGKGAWILQNTTSSALVRTLKTNLSQRAMKRILGLTINNKFSFDNHIRKTWRKGSQKICALSRISNYLDLKQKEINIKWTIISQFSYCSLMWMRSLRKSDNLIRYIERSFSIVDIGLSERSFRIALITI